MAQHIFKQTTGRCPALEEADGDRLVCGFVASPQRWNPFQTAVVGVAKMREAALVLIGHGTGCDAIFVGERKNAAYLKSKEEEAKLDPYRLPSRRFMRAMVTWFGRLP